MRRGPGQRHQERHAHVLVVNEERMADIAGMLVKYWDRDIIVRYSGAARAGDPFSLLADDARLRQLAFEWRVPIDRGLADYVRWFKGQVR